MSSKKQQTRQRMLDAASQSFRSKGYAGIGVDGIARSAGVTSGAFYAHFGSKDAAFEAALVQGLDEVIEAIPRFKQQAGSQWPKAFAEYYLSRSHREDLSHGCAMATLTPEVVRTGTELHAAYEKKMKTIVDLIADGLDDMDEDIEQRRDRAWAFLGVLIGGITLARAVKTRTTADRISTDIVSAALGIVGQAD